MGCCNEPVNLLAPLASDPSQHVHYTRGMVLGVDDFDQEFAYLIGRQRWLARDAIGYGTLSGLRIAVDDAGADGLRIRVGAGSALLPSGQLICVGSEQCCVLDAWLARPANAELVARLLAPGSPPPSPPLSPPVPPAPGDTGTLELFLTLCWAQCESGLVPIPGEPCRDDNELMAPSRIADHFKLELRESAPDQTEEDALRDFVAWLRANVLLVETSPPPSIDEAAWMSALRPAAQPWLDAMSASPPMSPPPGFATLGDYLADLSPAPINLARSQICDFLRVAYRFWITELRPIWQAMRCHRVERANTDCLLLAAVRFDVVFVGGSPSGVWQLVAGSPASVAIDESRRPLLAHLRLMQEWMLCGCDCATADAGAPGPVFLGPAQTPPSANRHRLTEANADLQLDFGHELVIGRGAPKLRVALPPSAPINAGQVIVVKNVDVGSLTLLPDPASGDSIEGRTRLAVKKGGATSLAADGAGQWLVLHTV